MKINYIVSFKIKWNSLQLILNHCKTINQKTIKIRLKYGRRRLTTSTREGWRVCSPQDYLPHYKYYYKYRNHGEQSDHWIDFVAERQEISENSCISFIDKSVFIGFDMIAKNWAIYVILIHTSYVLTQFIIVCFFILLFFSKLGEYLVIHSQISFILTVLLCS